LSISWEQIERWWEYWLLWRFVGQRVEAFMMVLNWYGPLPKSMMDTFAEIDNFYNKMDAQKMKEEAKENKYG